MPTVEPRKMGASLHIYGQMSPRNQPERSQLFSTEVTNLGEESEPQEILSPMLPWEGQGIANPVWLTDLPNLEPLLLYTSIDGAIGVFRRAAGRFTRATESTAGCCKDAIDRQTGSGEPDGRKRSSAALFHR
jgi:hypothetical protein